MSEKYGLDPAKNRNILNESAQRTRLQEVRVAVEEMFQAFFTQYSTGGSAKTAALKSPILSILSQIGNIKTEDQEYHEKVKGVAAIQGRDIRFILAIVGKYHDLRQDSKDIILQALDEIGN